MHLYLQMQILAQLTRKSLSQMNEVFGVSLIEPRKTNIIVSVFLAEYLPCCQFFFF